MMNERAREIGLTSSNFANATGLPDAANKSTVRDLAKLAQHIIKTYPDDYKSSARRNSPGTRSASRTAIRCSPWISAPTALRPATRKTAAMASSARPSANGLRLIVVINGLKSEKERADEGKKLLEWGFRGFEAKLLFAEGQTVGEARLFGGEQMHVPLVGKDVITLMVPRDSNDRIIGEDRIPRSRSLLRSSAASRSASCGFIAAIASRWKCRSWRGRASAAAGLHAAPSMP